MVSAKISAPNTLMATAALLGSREQIVLEYVEGRCLRLARLVTESAMRWPAGTFYTRLGVTLTARNQKEDPTNPWSVSVEDTLIRKGYVVPLAQAAAGDLVFARPHNPRAPQFDKFGHVGVLFFGPDGRLWVLENAVVRRGRSLGGAVNIVPLADWDEVTTVARIPASLATPPKTAAPVKAAAPGPTKTAVAKKDATVITPEMLRVAAPGIRAGLPEKYAPLLERAAEEFGIKTPRQVLMFVANVAHESWDFNHLEEVWEPTATQRGYETRRDLGNVRPGDGFKFRGRGFIQLTGRWNFEHFGKRVGIDLGAQPERASLPDVAARLAACFWDERHCNALADAGSFQGVANAINRWDAKAYPARLARYSRLRTYYGVS